LRAASTRRYKSAPSVDQIVLLIANAHMAMAMDSLIS
jgi:hypothetical protein